MFRLVLTLLATAWVSTATARAGDDPPPAADYPPPTYVERADRSLSDGLDFVALLGWDFWSIVREPFVMDGRSWLKVGAAAATFTVLYQYDQEIMDAVQRNRDGDLFRAVEEIGNTFEKLGLMGETGTYYAAGIVVGYSFQWEKLERVSTDILFSHWTGGLLRQGFIRVVERSRPNEGRGPYDFGNGGSSLPSGHSSTVFQLATVISHHFPAWYVKGVAYGIATCVVFQRVASEQHWASDAFVGAAFGHAIGRIVVQANDRRGHLVVPTFDPSSGRAGLSLRWDF